jgi:UDP-N-acetylmuramyl tripeptide synthase
MVLIDGLLRWLPYVHFDFGSPLACTLWQGNVVMHRLACAWAHGVYRSIQQKSQSLIRTHPIGTTVQVLGSVYNLTKPHDSHKTIQQYNLSKRASTSSPMSYWSLCTQALREHVRCLGTILYVSNSSYNNIHYWNSKCHISKKNR